MLEKQAVLNLKEKKNEMSSEKLITKVKEKSMTLRNVFLSLLTS